MLELQVARSELILGGQRSGKSRRAEALAGAWLSQSSSHAAVLLATGLPLDEEMKARIARHQADRAACLPRLSTVEAAKDLSEALREHSQPKTLAVIDCLTLWLTQLRMPLASTLTDSAPELEPSDPVPALLSALAEARGPVVLVSNEIGLGVVPMGRQTRDFVDALGRLNQAVAQVCDSVTFMAAGLPLTLKAQP